MSNEPAAWLTAHRHLLPESGDALDVACGRGRNALWLAAQGFAVRAIDRDADAVAVVNAEARRRGVGLVAEVHDLETGDPGLPSAAFDVVVATHYLHRPLFPHLVTALRPGGVLVYETFTREQALRGQPTNPAFLLERGELVRLIAPLTVLASREADSDGRFIASVVATRGPDVPRHRRSEPFESLPR